MAEDNCRLLPEIIEEILIKLPVKSLSRFRCVSKSWQSLISDQNFVRKHFHLSPKALVLINPFNSDIEKFCLFHLPSLQIDSNINKICFPLEINYWELLSSCDGLLCIGVYQSVYILNPCVPNYCRKFPKSASGTQLCYFGLGYDLERDYYKLFRVTITGPGHIAQTDVYSLKMDSWIKLGNFPLDYFPYCWSVFLNGSIYWLAIPAGSRPNTFALFAFDLSDYKYKETTLPEFFSPIPHTYVHIVPYVLNGMLCVLAASKPWVVLWAMKDVSDPKSWTKILNIRIHEAFDFDCPHVTPFYLYDNGHVLMGILSNHGTELLVCRHNTVFFRQIVFQKKSLIHFGFLHVESLISPYAYKRRRVKLRPSRVKLMRQCKIDTRI